MLLDYLSRIMTTRNPISFRTIIIKYLPIYCKKAFAEHMIQLNRGFTSLIRSLICTCYVFSKNEVYQKRGHRRCYI
ncbi:unnamed protein product [Schistosoma mansoni]|uniref:Smp_205360 n=1 Tax=Schistosoma mansoni TaxID=6183 RepID=UPI00022C8301|nr:unnamed protein product [Schistosoma mansoni]|eukprot:XP_018644705.1 unnamed protein product [Schistosoma mansoni]